MVLSPLFGMAESTRRIASLLGDRPTVGLQNLDLRIGVRIPVSQPNYPVQIRLLFLIFAVVLSTARAQQAVPQPRLKPGQPANVAVGDHVFFEIRLHLGPFSPAERANATSAKIARLTKDLSAKVATIVLDEHETSSDILAGDVVLTTVTEADAQAMGRDRSSLANDYLGRIRGGVELLRTEYSYRSLLLGSLYALLVTLTIIGVLFLLRYLSQILRQAIDRRRGTRIRTLRIQKLELMSEARITEFLLQLVKFARLAITLLLFYFYIPLVFSFFPWTRSFGATLLGYLLAPIGAGWNAFVSYVPSMLVVLVIVCFAYVATRIARFVFTEIERGTISTPGFYPEWAMPTFKIVELLIIAFALVVMFPYLPGSDSPAFKGISIFLGVLFSLGSSSAVANVIAGVILTYTRAFRLGDRVQIADTVGDVVSKNLLATQLRTIKNVQITIPNALVLGSHIINFNTSAAGKTLILHSTVTIGSDAPWRDVHALLLQAAAKTPGVLQAPEPFVLQKSLDDFYVSYEINAHTDQPHIMAVIYSNLHQNIQDAFNEAGIEIMSPHYNALRDGNNTAIPSSYLPPQYQPQSFRFSRTTEPTK